MSFLKSFITKPNFANKIIVRNFNLVPSPIIRNSSKITKNTRVSGILSRYLATGLSSEHEVWKLGRLNHVAIAVPNLTKAIDFYRNILGAHEVSDAMFGNTKIELIHPYGDKSPIKNFLENNKMGGIHHICIEVDNIKVSVKDLTSKKVRVLDPEPKIGAHGNPVVFLHPQDCGGVLVELEEEHEVWKLGRLNHVAIAVPNLTKAIDFYRNILGAHEVSDAMPQTEYGVIYGLVTPKLIHPYGDKSPIKIFLKKIKWVEFITFVLKWVDNIKVSVKDLTSKKVRVLDPEPKIGAHDNLVFLHSKIVVAF
ncbi:1565_t:CDS:2 [Diversispora eburnea]|uniref:1565_t:CDS:1 n=1 Tax=Diversispora eburnea TaxID=1213867 RepID=A0A9N8UWB3_9GLOM|nr:1565_t:CDS:2 [Diversispora eburnea]